MSDREQAGLRGPVTECTEEHIVAATDRIPESKYNRTYRYDEAGRVVEWATRTTHDSNVQEFSTSFTYDQEGRLSKSVTTSPGQSAKESLHTYDERGREAAILDNGQPTAFFEYDARGVKTRFTPTPTGAVNLYSSAASTTVVASSALDADDPYLPMPPGGQLKTTFDQTGRPVEWKIVDANGTVLNRLLRRYDHAGRLLETAFTVETLPLSHLKDQLLQAPDLAADDREMLLRPDFEQAALAELLGPQKVMSTISYAYDARGHLTEKRERMGRSLEMVTAIAYNEHSDKSSELFTQAGDPNVPAGASIADYPNAMPSQSSERHFSYRYDEFGNWTERTTTSSADSAHPTEVVRRTLKYF